MENLNNKRIIFAGTPDFAAICLKKLIQSGYNIVATYTQPDRPAGRGKKLQPSPVKSLALEYSIPVEQPLNFKSTEALAQLKAYNADLMIVVAYGLILPREVLDTPTHGCINVHASLLPRWRGAAPIQRAIEAGDEITGVGIMQMELGLDTGAVWAEQSVAIEAEDTGASLHDKLAEVGANCLIESLPIIFSGESKPTPQSEDGVEYAHKMTKQEAQINWQLSAIEIERKIRAFNSWPVAYFLIHGAPCRLWQAELGKPTDQLPGTIVTADKSGITVACGEGSIIIKELQPAGSRKMAVSDLLNSKAHWFSVGASLAE